MYQKYSSDEAKMMLSLDFNIKEKMAMRRVADFIDYFGEERVYVSFSGGLDSLVVLNMARQLVGSSIKAIYLDTYMEIPSMREFVYSYGDKVDLKCLKPKKTLKKIIEDDGFCFPSKEVAMCINYMRNSNDKNSWAYKKMHGLDKNGNFSEFRQQYVKFLPVIDWDVVISDRCCFDMKHGIAQAYEKENDTHPLIGTRIEESRMRLEAWRKTGCITGETVLREKDGELVEVKADRPACRPISIFTKQDVYRYLDKYNIILPSVYGELAEVGSLPGQYDIFLFDKNYVEDYSKKNYYCCGGTCNRTGCMFCLAGILKEPGRFKRMKNFNSKMFEYMLEELGMKKIISLIEREYHVRIL